MPRRWLWTLPTGTGPISMEFVDLRVPAVFIGVALPLLSTIVMSSTRREYLYRLLQVVAAYLIVFGLVFVGYVFESVLSAKPSVQYYTIPFLDKVRATLRGQWETPGSIYITIIVSCVICCALLFGHDSRSRTVNTLRAAFFSFMAFDIFVGMEINFTIAEYIYNVVFNLAGAFVLSVVAPSFLEWIPHRNHSNAQRIADR